MEKLYTILECCKILKVTRQTIYNWIKNEKIKVVNVGSRNIRIKQSEIEKLVG